MDHNDRGRAPSGELEAMHVKRGTEGSQGGISRRSLLNGAGAVGGAVLASSLLTGTATAQTETAPISGARFTLVSDGYVIATFSELSGIVAEVEPSEYWGTSDKAESFRKLPRKPPTVVLRRVMDGSMELWAWHEAVRDGNLQVARKSCALNVFNPLGEPVARYFLTNAWPSRIEISGLEAGTSEVLMETVTLTVEMIQRSSV